MVHASYAVSVRRDTHTEMTSVENKAKSYDVEFAANPAYTTDPSDMRDRTSTSGSEAQFM